MAHGVIATDFCTLCLWLVDGELEASLATLIRRSEQYQAAQGSHFGCSDEDFRYALVWLGLELELLDWRCVSREDLLTPRLQELTLQELLPGMLKYRSVWFNDEGEYWDRPRQQPSDPYRDALVSLLDRPTPSAAEVCALLTDHGWRQELMLLFLDSGLTLTFQDRDGNIALWGSDHTS